jgi:hypothetical protein
VRDQVPHRYTIIGKAIAVYLLILYIQTAKWEEKLVWGEW